MAKNKKYKDPELLQLYWDNKKLIGTITLSTAVLTALISLFLPIYYKSAVVMYPSTVGAVSKSLVEPGPMDDFLAYGSEQNAEHLLQFLESAGVKGYITQKFDLYNHYGLPEGMRLRDTKLNKQYQQNFKFRRTKLGSILVEVYDKDPELAARMANDVAAYADSVRNALNRGQAQKALQILNREIAKLNTELKTIEDSLGVLRGMGLIDYKAQAPLIAAELSAKKEKSDLARVFAQYAGTFNTLTDLQEHYVEQLALYKARKDIVAMDADAQYNYSFIVDNAYPSEVKAKPKRWLMVLSSTASAFLFSLILVVFLVRIRQLSSAK
ncbi:MAG: hypothetical protein ACXITV_01400 [Luteibaculaceae bacterium]